MNKFAELVGFNPEEKNTTLRTEFIAGVVTFLAMAYILTVNPNQIFGAGSPYWASAFIATALGAIANRATRKICSHSQPLSSRATTSPPRTTRTPTFARYTEIICRFQTKRRFTQKRLSF